MIVRLIPTLVLTLALVGCTATPDDDTSEVAPAVVEALDVPVLTGEPSGMEALGTYTLQYDAELNCLYHDEPDNNGEPGTGGRVVIQWLRGTTASLADGVVTVVDTEGNEIARTGEPVTLTGGGTAFLGSDHCNAVGIWMVSG